MSYTQIINDAPIKDTTKKTYLNCIIRLEKICKTDWFTVVKEMSTYLPILEKELKLNSLANLVCTLYSLLKYGNFDEDQIKKWKEKYVDPIKKQKEQIAQSGLPSIKDLKINFTWIDVIKIYNDIPETDLVNKILLGLYVLSPVGRQMEYQKIWVRPEPPPEDATSHLLLLHKPPILKLLKHKTIKQDYSDPIVHPETAVLIYKYILQTNNDWLFTDKNGNPFKDPKSFTNWNNYRLKIIFNNPDISVNALRRLYASYNTENLSPHEIFKRANDMRHGVGTHLTYRYKKDEVNDINI